MGLYEVTLSMSLLGFGIGTILANFYMCGIVVKNSFKHTREECESMLLFVFRDLWKKCGDSNFQIFSHNYQFHHRRLESLVHLNVFLLYTILSTTFFDLKDAILFFTWSPFFV